MSPYAFANKTVLAEYEHLHRKCKQWLSRYALWSKWAGFPNPTLTDIMRTPEWYAANGLTPPRFSWHYVGCAMDLRVRNSRTGKAILSPDEEASAKAWIVGESTPSSMWEIIFKDHGTGPHWHIAYRDFSLRKKWEAAHGS